MSRFPCFFAGSGVLLLRDDCLIRSPEIREAMASTVSRWNGLPQATTGGLAPISTSIGDHLTTLSTEGDPDPSLIGLFGHKGPQLIQFEDLRSGIAGTGREGRLTQWGKLFGFF